jgi:type I restriction enzyme S subunit
MKASGVAWLGEVPGHWEVKRLKFACDLVNDKTDHCPNDSLYVGLENIESGTGRWLAGDSISPESQALRFNQGDVLFGKLRPYLAKALLTETSGCCSSEFVVFRGRSLLPGFLRYWCVSPHFISVVDGSTYGSKMPRADPAFIGSLPCTVPPIKEQRAIATFLDRETARIDALVAAKRRLIALLQEKRSALIARAVTRGLDPDVPTKDSGVAWLGRVPAHWQVLPLKRMASARGGLTPDKGRADYWDGDIPWITPKDMKRLRLIDSEDHTTDLALAETALQWVEPPAALIVVRGMILAHSFPVAEIDGAVTINQDMKALSTLAGVDTPYLAWLLRGARHFVLSCAEESAHGTKVLRTEVLFNALFPVPPLHEQRSIVQHIEVEAAKLEQASAAIEAALARLTEYRATLITAAVTGRIDVRAAA